MQFLPIILVLLFAHVNGGSLKLSGDCGSRMEVTRSKDDGNDPAIVTALATECSDKWSQDLTKLIECLQMAIAVNNLIKETADEAVLLQLIVFEINAYKDMAVIQNGAIEEWGTIKQFMECKGASATTTTTNPTPTTTTKRTTTTPGKLDCSGMEKVLLKNADGRIVILAAIEDGCYKYASASTCMSLLSTCGEAINGEWPEKVREIALRIDWSYYEKEAKNAIRRTIIPTWPSSSKPGTLLNFADCGGPLIGGGNAIIIMNMSIPSSWTYPPQLYPAGQGQQTKQIAEANAKAAFDKVKAAIERVDGSLVVENITLSFAQGVEALDYAKRNSINYAGYIGGVVQIDNNGKIVGVCTKGKPNSCTTAGDFDMGRHRHPTAILQVIRIMGPSIFERMMRAFALSLYEQGILLDEDEIHYEEWE